MCEEDTQTFKEKQLEYSRAKARGKPLPLCCGADGFIKEGECYNWNSTAGTPQVTVKRQIGPLSLVQIVEVLRSHWLSLTMLAQRSMP